MLANNNNPKSSQLQKLSFSLLRSKPLLLRFDVMSLFIFQFVIQSCHHFQLIPNSLHTVPPQEYDFFDYYSVILVVHILGAILSGFLFLLNFWSPRANAIIAFTRIQNKFQIQIATHVFIRAKVKKLNKMVQQIQPIHTRKYLQDSKEDDQFDGNNSSTWFEIYIQYMLNRPYFDFQKKRFIWDQKLQDFQKFDANKILLQQTSVKQYVNYYSKLSQEDDMDIPSAIVTRTPPQILSELMGSKNQFNIPEPTFFDMYKQHIAAPMFVFQILFSVLWLFDEYWKFAFMQLGMLFVFQGTIVMQRRMNLKRIRSIKLPSRKIHVFREWEEEEGKLVLQTSRGGSGRNNKKKKNKNNNSQLIRGRWTVIDSKDLVPGDICAIKFVSSSNQKKDSPQKKEPQRQNVNNIVPCDLMLIQGSAIVNQSILTGETVPLIKDGLKLTDLSPDTKINLKKDSHKRHILFGGTQIIQTQAHQYNQNSENGSVLPRPPIHGSAICQVLRTGFETNQGKIIRTMLFNNQRVTVQSRQAYFFLLMLLFFALIAAGYVLNNGLNQYYEYMDSTCAFQASNPLTQDDQEQENGFVITDNTVSSKSFAKSTANALMKSKKVPSLYRIIYRCVLILTSVVPPQLPIQLSLAVNSCLSDLMKRAIFCTEPFRIPLAGRVDVCCFDKTGTLTKDRLKVEGIMLSDSVKKRNQAKQIKSKGRYQVTPLEDLNDCETVQMMRALQIIASCHSIVSSPSSQNDKLMGDPIQVASFEGIGWKWNDSSQTAQRKKGGNQSIKLLRRFAFSSDLKRMTVIAKQSGNYKNDQSEKIPFEGRKYSVLTKGAPEQVGKKIVNFKTSEIEGCGLTYIEYVKAYKQLMRAGKRVLTLASRYLYIPQNDINSSIYKINRDQVQRDLNFCGFLVMKCPLKKDTRGQLELLKAAKHKLIMITGDNVLTAAHVAQTLEFTQNQGLGNKISQKIKNQSLSQHKQKQASQQDEQDLQKCEEEKLQTKTKQRKTPLFLRDPKSQISKCIPPQQQRMEPSLLKLNWVDYEQNKIATTQHQNQLQQLSNQYMLCCEGNQLDNILANMSQNQLLEKIEQEKLKQYQSDQSNKLQRHLFLSNSSKFKLSILFSYISVFARTSPFQKDFIIQRLNDKGLTTLMCGDGTNDVGSLKRANVGIALVNRPYKQQKEYFNRMKSTNVLGLPSSAPGQQQKRTGFWQLYAETQKQMQAKAEGKPYQSPFQMMQQHQQKNQSPQNLFLGDKTIAQQGDACIAAPFTYRFSSIKSVTDLIRQGRCTLVTTFQMYRILAISSLMTAYTMSALYLDDDKYADLQMMILGMVQMVFYFTLAFSKPIEQLAPYRPPSSIFKCTEMVSIFGQFIIQFTSLIYLIQMLKQVGEGDFDNPFLQDLENKAQNTHETNQASFFDTQAQLTEEDPWEQLYSLLYSKSFNPSLKNTVLFLYSMVNTTTIFIVNSTGRPFKEGLTDRRAILYVTVVLYGLAMALALQIFPSVSSALLLVALPSPQFAFKVFLVLVFNLFGSVLVEAGVRKWEYGVLLFQA